MKQAKRFIGIDKSVKTSVIGLWLVISMFIIGSIWIVNTQNGINYQLNHLNTSNTPKQQDFRGIITAYNLTELQTDSTPCISAYNIDVCQLQKQGINIVANNCLAQGTEIEIIGLGRFVVLDRMNSRYGCEYFDIAMAGDEVVEAIKFGRQERGVIIYE